MWKKITLFICFWVTVIYAEPKYYVSVCMIFRDEALYLKEWIEFHRLIGIEHFYLCSHNSQDGYKNILNPYIKKGVVELKELNDDNNEVNDFNHVQCQFYNDCLNKARNESKWVAFIDADEFLVPVQKKSLANFLKLYEDFGGVTANWQMFGSSYVHHLQSDKLMIEQLIHCAPLHFEMHKHVKSIVQPLYVTHFYNPHYANYLPGYYQVNTDRIPFTGHESPYFQVNQLRINHYWTRDEYYFLTYKVPRMLQLWGPSYVEGAKETLILFNQDCDLMIQRWVPRLRKKMGMKR